MNIRTLDDTKKQSKKDAGSKKKTTQSYTGGESSGMAVINPDVSSLIEKAEKSSKQGIDKSRSYEQFAKEQHDKNENCCRITLYQNGFQIDDGQFYDYNQPENKKFLNDLNSGKIPPKLKQKYPHGQLSISLNQKTKQKYVPPPPPPYVAFSGSGTSLSEAKPATKFTKKKVVSQNFILQPNRNKPLTTIKVRLFNDSQTVVEINLDTKIQELYNHIATISGTSQFELIGGFPPKPLNMEITIEQGDLAGCTIIQKAL